MFNFVIVELLVFYFDICKDVLYCDGDMLCSCVVCIVMDLLFECLIIWLVLILVFIMEEVWLEWYMDENVLVYLVDMFDIFVDWLDELLVVKWVNVCSVCCVVMVVLEV